nr:probable leucine--tRNA ligase, mitochondrial [Leptinotarsa decemlineata]
MIIKKSRILKQTAKHHSLLMRTISGINLWNDDISTEVKHKIENHWRGRIRNKNVDNDSTREKYYVLPMFPYPSGFLHMGHVRVYTISDTVARFQRMNGKNVLHPIGWDAFGLPAENAAIDRKIPPGEWTSQNITHMKKQLIELGCDFEWEREFSTCDPQYYRWTQDLFLKLYDAGLVYQKEALVNWDPEDKTVLADEQVDENGNSWRSGAKVEKKLLRQWFIRTTKFAKDLLDGLDDPVLQDWKDITKLQKHWIGECNGVSFDFQIKNDSGGRDFLPLWTSKPEYVEHAKFVAVTTDNILAKHEGIQNCEQTVKLRVQLKNPINGESVPVYVTSEIDFLPFTDSYLGIPDVFSEATKFASHHNITFETVKEFSSGEELEWKRQEICNRAKKLNVGGYWTSAKLRDWLISRQRYWGTPIPIIHCQKCGIQPVPRRELPVVLPKLAHITLRGVSPLAEIQDWVNTICPECEGAAKRETDTMDTFVDSSWYYLRFLDHKNENEIFSKEKARKFSPVDLYIGGKEHAVLHMYYARFVSHFLYSLGLLPEREPFKRLLVQGMVMGRSYRVKGTGEYLHEDSVTILDLKRNKAEKKGTGEEVVISWEKMSKSKHNGVDPQDMFTAYGTDTTRLLILADVAPTSHRNWNSNTFPGILNWQRRLWLTIREFLAHRTSLPAMLPEGQFKPHDEYMFDSRNFYIKGVTFNYLVSQQLSVAVSKQQGLTNSLRVGDILHIKNTAFDRVKTQLSNITLFFKVNGFENSVVKIPRRDLDKLSKDEAIRIALGQKEVQNTLTTRNVLDICYTMYDGCEGVVNILTDHPPPKVKAQKAN